MKLSSGFRFSRLLWLSSAALMVCATVVRAETKARTAFVTALAGEARVSKGGSGDFVPLAIGVKLNDGDVVKTSGGSHVDIDMANNVGAVQVAPNSTVLLRKLTVNDTGADRVTETDIEVKEGAIFFQVNKLAKASRYEITTPKGIAGIRGTAGYINADGQLTIAEGTAGIAYPNGGGADTFIVHDGETVGPTDRPPHPAPGSILRDIVDALRDATTHGIGRDLQPFVPPVEPFISPTLPGKD